jgi:radical SAM-linked protein
VVGIANESFQALQVGWKYGRNIDLNVSVSSFVPKPFTPFQWEPQMTIAETRRKHALVRKNLKHRSLNFKHHDAEMSFLEGLFARGDRRLSQVIHQAFMNGCRFDEWGEHFDFAKWQKTFSETGVDLDFYLHRKRDFTEVFPWDHLFTQMRKDWLWQEYQAAAKEAFVADCSIEKCADFCGVCDFKTVKNKIYVVDEKPLAVKKGNREWYGRFGDGANLDKLAENLGTATARRGPTNNVEPSPQMKLRVKFIKMGWAALQGHLELMEILKRAILRSKVPAAYSGGFHPQMKLAMGYALPLGIESECEFFDLTILEPVVLPEFLGALNQALPGGLQVVAAEYIDLNAASIYAQTRWVSYQVRWPSDDFVQANRDFYKTLLDLQQGKDLVFLRQKRGDKHKEKAFSIKDHLRFSTELSEKSDFFEFSLRCDPDGSLKPSELVSALSGIPVAELAGLRIKKVGVDLAL